MESLMPSERWREQYETGLEPIDAQHRGLFEALDRLAGALGSTAKGRMDESRVDEELAFIAQHIIRHCQTEESLMKEMGFPGRLAHAEQHLELIHRARDLQYRRLKGQRVDLEVVAFLDAWLDHHICESDLAYVAYLKDHRGA
jgi:hemerythrin-like metal-binding protein